MMGRIIFGGRDIVVWCCRLGRKDGCVVRLISAICHSNRYLEMAFWTMETMGQPLPDAVASTVRWREEAKPHLVTDQQVTKRLDPCITLT